MSIFTKIKNLFTKFKNKVVEVELTISEFVTNYKKEIVQAMKLADLAYDNFEGSEKMKSVISFFIMAVNNKCGTQFNAEQIGTDATKELEEKFQEVYNNLKA